VIKGDPAAFIITGSMSGEEVKILRRVNWNGDFSFESGLELDSFSYTIIRREAG